MQITSAVRNQRKSSFARKNACSKYISAFNLRFQIPTLIQIIQSFQTELFCLCPTYIITKFAIFFIREVEVSLLYTRQQTRFYYKATLRHRCL